ncbi:MAG: hypothetical protein IBX63_09925 [Coriobacteriia bacterium]|nr:hypothetical protein [Coriobacteriia bacterium]
MGEKRYVRGALACMLAGFLVMASACSRGPGVGSDRDSSTGGAPDVAYRGTLVYLDGEQVFSIDATSGTGRALYSLEGELGWSGFARLTDDGGLIYESLLDETSSVHLASEGSAGATLATGVERVHDYNGTVLLVTADNDTHALGPGANRESPGALGIGIALSAVLSADGSEFAYASQVPTATPEADLGEFEQTLSIRSFNGSGPGTKVAGGWLSIEPLLLDSDALVYASYPFGGTEIADLLLYDRRSEESTTLATNVRLLDRDPARSIVAIAIASPDETVGDAILIIDVSDPDAVRTISFESGTSDSLTATQLLADGSGLVAAFGHEDGASTLVEFDTRDGSQRTVTELADSIVSQVLPHPDRSVAFVVVQSGGPEPVDITRSIAVCDLSEGTTSTLVTGSASTLLTLIGISKE